MEIRKQAEWLDPENGTLLISEGIELIPKEAFWGRTDFRRVIVPGTVRTIGAGAFAGCTNLEEAVLGEGVRRLADGCFENCVRLRRISLAGTVASIRARAFAGCTALTEIRLPASLRRNIETGTFSGCTALERVNIPQEIMHIMPRAFSGCVCLKEVAFEAGEVRIAADSFSGCTALSGETLHYIKQHVPSEHVMDIRSTGHGISGRLSNFTGRQFVLDGVACGSIEGVLQSFKCPDAERQKEICALHGGAAKHAGQGYEWQADRTLYWQGVRYDRLSAEYRQLLDRLYDAVYEQDEAFRADVQAIYGMEIDHRMGHASPQRTILTRGEFLGQMKRLSARAAEDASRNAAHQEKEIPTEEKNIYK